MAKSILIVDDEPNIVVSLEFLLKREGYQVAVAGDGEEAMNRLRQVRPDLVLLDVMLPLKNGFAVCQEIRADAQLAGVKILMLSAKGRDTEVQKGMALGADAYMTKPFATKDLVAKLRELLGE